MGSITWKTIHPEGKWRVIVTKNLPGSRWIDILVAADCRLEVCTSQKTLTVEQISAAIGGSCHGAIGQLTEDWGEKLFGAFKQAGGRIYSNYAVGFNNIDLEAATRFSIPIGNTPGVLTETTAEMALTLTFAAARRTGEAERYLRAGRYDGWLPTLFLGELLHRKTVGIIGAGRIGATYARMMAEGHQTDLVYFDPYPNEALENYIRRYSQFLESMEEEPVVCRRTDSLKSLLEESDCVSIHTVLDASTHHLIDAEKLSFMKKNAILINTSRGPVIDEAALVEHCRRNPEFRAGLDVFEREPDLADGLNQLENVVIVPHIASATRWTRNGMAILAASNVAGILKGYPLWGKTDISPFLQSGAPEAVPSIVNAAGLGLEKG